VTTVSAAEAYRDRILEALPEGSDFTPLMTCYLVDRAEPAELVRGFESGAWVAAKLYPAHATTNSAHGVTSVDAIARGLEAMEKAGMPLLVHGEVTDPSVDVFDREAVFLERELAPMLARFPGLRVVVEHITTRQAVDFVRAAGDNVAATITAHHLLLSRNAMFTGGLRPHAFCLPVLKRERHREALVAAAISGEAKFFLGTDSAPHARTAKEAECGCAGIYTAHAAIELYAEAFAAAGAIDRLEGFACRFGPRFYGLPVNTARVRLVDDAWTVPASYPLGEGEVVPMRAGTRLGWRML